MKKYELQTQNSLPLVANEGQGEGRGSGFNQSVFGGPGFGFNGPGLNGTYYDYYTNSFRSTSEGNPAVGWAYGYQVSSSFGASIPSNANLSSINFERNKGVGGVRFLQNAYVNGIYKETRWRFIPFSGNASAQGGGYDFGRTNNAFSMAGLGWGINENVWVNNGQWLGKNLKYNSLAWEGNQWTGARSIALKSAKVAKVLGRAAFGVNLIYGGYSVFSGVTNGDYSGALFSGLGTTYSGIATYGGLPGLVIAGPLVFIDATIGLDTYMQNQIDVGILRGNQISNGNYSMWAYPRFGQSVR